MWGDTLVAVVATGIVKIVIIIIIIKNNKYSFPTWCGDVEPYTLAVAQTSTYSKFLILQNI